MSNNTLTSEPPTYGRSVKDAETFRENAAFIASRERSTQSWTTAFAAIMEQGYVTGRVLNNPRLLSLTELSDTIVPGISIQLSMFVKRDADDRPIFDFAELGLITAHTVRMADNLVDHFAHIVRGVLDNRRIGIGAIGMPAVLAALGLTPQTRSAWRKSSEILEHLKLAAYRTSVGLAAEKGVYPAFNTDEVLSLPAIRLLPQEVREDIAYFGLRNAQIFRCPLSADE